MTLKADLIKLAYTKPEAHDVVMDILRKAALLPEEQSTARYKMLFSERTARMLFRAFTARGMPFFDLYYTIYASFHDGTPPEEGFAESFRASSRIIYQMMTTENGKATFMDTAAQLRPLMGRLDTGNTSSGLARRIAELYTTLIYTVARERDVFLVGRTVDAQGWILFRVASEKEQKLQQLQRDDPEMYSNIQRSREVQRTLDRRIQEAIKDQGLEPSTTKILDRVVNTGVDPSTGERYVFDQEGNVDQVEDYVVKRKQQLRLRKPEKIFPSDLNALRKVSDEELAELGEGPVTYHALTDDKAQSHPVTRIYPVRNIAGQLVVVDGRFKGFLLDDLVNSTGRMIEGVAYDYDPKVGHPTPMETKNADGTLNVHVSREPYATVDSQGDLLLRIPSGHNSTAFRNAMFELSKIIPSVRYVEGSRKASYTFDPKDFAAVRNALNGLALSTTAMEKIRKHFIDLAQHELATADNNLQHYTTGRIGGFRPGKELFVKQRKALAWLESRKMSGVIALDTGLGKTSWSIAAMQKMVRDGYADDPSKGNGRFLYVCPTALVGNLPKEIHGFMSDPDALLDRVDVMSYNQFAKLMKKDPNFAASYVSIFFDEAQALKNPGADITKAVLKLKHPRKVALTASPMERSPMEVFVLASITNNIDLNTPDGRTRMQAFRKRFCEEVGGRIVGIKADPITSRDLRVWVKQNLFFADKRDVEEIALPQLRKETVALTMPPTVEVAYRDITDRIQGILTGLVAKYRDRDLTATDPALEAARVRLRREFTAMNELSLMPDVVVPGTPNPKLDQVSLIVSERAESSRRVLLFTDVPKMAAHTVEVLSNRFPGKMHAVGLANAIEVWQDGAVKARYGKREYKTADGVTFKPSEWKVYVLKHIISANPEVMTLTLTATYAVGQNLQSFSTVVHLDRDSWNNETMKQRTARAWRTGQQNTVEEVILDMVYTNPRATQDATLDEIQAAMQHLEGELFDRVVIESQTEALGKEFFEMKRTDSSFYALNRRTMLLQLSPYLARMGQEG